MCGISGVFSYKSDSPLVDRVELTTIKDYMSSRGPDSEGIWISDDSKIGLAHNRLSIIDTSQKASQPMIDFVFC